MMIRSLLTPFLILFITLTGSVSAQTDKDRQERVKDMQDLFQDFFEDDSFQRMRERMESMIKQMEEDFEGPGSLFGSGDLNKILRGSGLFKELGHGQHEWMETKEQCTLVLNYRDLKDSPLEINVEKNQVKVQGRVEIENIEETPHGTSKTVQVQQINKIFLVPEVCDPNSVEIENKDGEILVKFSKFKQDERRPIQAAPDQETI